MIGDWGDVAIAVAFHAVGAWGADEFVGALRSEGAGRARDRGPALAGKSARAADGAIRAQSNPPGGVR